MSARPAMAALASLMGLALGPVPSAIELKPDTLKAFDRYVQLTEARMAAEVEGRSPFLWIDRQPEAQRSALYERLRRGDVLATRLVTRDGSADVKVKDGLIHHWVGTILLPGASIDRVMAFVKDYARYAEHFAPTIQRSRVIVRTGDHFDVAMRSSMKRIITVVLDAEYAIDYRSVSPKPREGGPASPKLESGGGPIGSNRIYTKSIARNVFEVENAGRADERRKPADQGTGFLWRLNNYCSFEERPEGTYEQCESVSLTRDVPIGLAWVVKPFITGIPRDTLEFTLGKVRAGVTRNR